MGHEKRMRRWWLLLVARSQATTFTSTSTVVTVTSTTDPCVVATDACECAAGAICRWLAFSGGGGLCQNAHEPSEIECGLCDQQEKCKTSSCADILSACSCASATGCAWDSTACVDSFAATPCSACPTQVGCDVDPPRVVAYSPANGGSYSSGADLRIVLQFSERVTWCPSTETLRFWCAGSVNDESIPRMRVQTLPSTWTIDMSWYLSSITLENERTCGLSIGSSLICDEEGIPFAGLAQGDYSFQLLDTVGPALIDFDPNSMSIAVPLDGNVNFLWSEPVMLNPTESVQAMLSRLEVDTTGTTAAVQTFAITLQAPNAEIISSSLLRIHLDGLLRSGKTYTLELPAGAVTDLAGNPSGDLPAMAYNFRAAVAATGGSVTTPTSGSAVGLVILIVSVAVFCILGGGIGLVKLVRSHGAALKNLLPKDRGSRERRPPSAVSAAPEKASFAAASAAAESAYRAAAAAAERLREEPANSSATNATGATGPAATWAQRPSSKTGNGKVHPGPTSAAPGFNSGRARRSSPPPKEEGGGQKPSAPAPESNLSPEVRAVEKKLHDMMEEPIATRRKLFKELLVEYHPDKNSSPHAKEVFQYVNNARSWFLVET
ncbi:unnamed protein product [Effrenium voratum]|uniref:SbsA Ig-like domain-containing protein n=1 Tax=Effrenium voratum TaxID=2562239 RepID=A0AA36J208_9DINO|nr:unnamed protein product [Effrenium voratum]CAJ1446557.1 unnamed protein product [Effrenium voratum]